MKFVPNYLLPQLASTIKIIKSLKIVKRLAKCWQKVGMLSKGCQKISKSCQKIVKKLTKIYQKVGKNCQKFVNKCQKLSKNKSKM
jgi:DNA anti-recombination protein RmuC